MSSLRLVRTNQPFRLLWTARSVSFLGDALSLVALMLYVADTTGQALAVAMLLLVGDFAPALLGPLTGTISDRFDLRRVMVGCELAQAGLMVVIALWLPSLPILPGRVALQLSDCVCCQMGYELGFYVSCMFVTWMWLCCSGRREPGVPGLRLVLLADD